MNKLGIIILITALLGLLTTCVIHPQFVMAADPYTSWVDQGVIYSVSGGNAYYPSVVYNNNGFGLGQSSPTYKMWYSDGSGGAFLTTSLDGRTWSSPTALTGLSGSAHHLQVLYDANNFGQGVSGPLYRLWYWNINSNLYDISSIYAAQSRDGINWTNVTALTQDSSAELVTGADTGWNRGSYGPVYLFYQPGMGNSGINPWNYTYVMYYDGTDGSSEDTGLAYSADGFYWIAYAGNPVLSHSPGSWDANDAVYGTIYHDSQGFHFWYSGGVSSPYDGIGYAYSLHGENWVKMPNPIFDINDGASYRDERDYTPAVINDGSGTLKMYYSVLATGSYKKIAIAYLPVPSPQIIFTKTVVKITDINNDGRPGPGDVLEYTCIVRNTGTLSGQNIVFSDVPDVNSSLIPGSVNSTQGTVSSGNNGGEKFVGVGLGDVPPGGQVTVTFRVLINNPQWEPQIINQAIVKGSNILEQLSDDPNTSQANDPTAIEVQTSPSLPGTTLPGMIIMVLGMFGAIAFFTRKFRSKKPEEP